MRCVAAVALLDDSHAIVNVLRGAAVPVRTDAHPAQAVILEGHDATEGAAVNGPDLDEPVFGVIKEGVAVDATEKGSVLGSVLISDPFTQGSNLFNYLYEVFDPELCL